MTSRSLNLIDLADAIRSLTQPSQHTEYIEATVIEPPAGRRRTTKRTRQRRPHTTTQPGLLEALHRAAVPGAAGDAGVSSGGFESRPSAELEPLSVLREIADDAGFWARTFGIEQPTLALTLSALVSAPTDDRQLELITHQADRWVRRARIAIGLDPAPVTLNEPCPYCMRRHALVISGDLRSAKCSRCGTSWSPNTIGLLADMLRTSETQETAAAVRCWMADCTERGGHELHRDTRGRTWRREDRCVDAEGVPVRVS